MKVLVDTSVFVASMIASHQFHQQARQWIDTIRKGHAEAVVSAHSLAETYSVLTRIPPPQRLSAAVAWRLIKQDLLDIAEVLALTSQEYQALIARLAQAQIVGGAVYDAVIAEIALKAQVDHIVTLNPRDFRRVNPSLTATVIVP